MDKFTITYRVTETYKVRDYEKGAGTKTSVSFLDLQDAYNYLDEIMAYNNEFEDTFTFDYELCELAWYNETLEDVNLLERVVK